MRQRRRRFGTGALDRVPAVALVLLAACSVEGTGERATERGEDGQIEIERPTPGTGRSITAVGFITGNSGLPARQATLNASFFDLGLAVYESDLEEPDEAAEEIDSCVLSEVEVDPFGGEFAVPRITFGGEEGTMSAGDTLPVSSDGREFDRIAKIEGPEGVRYDRVYPVGTELPRRVAVAIPGDEFPSTSAIDLPSVDPIEQFEPGIEAVAGEGTVFTWAPPSIEEEDRETLLIVISGPTQRLSCRVHDDGYFDVAEAARAPDEEAFGEGKLLSVTRQATGKSDEFAGVRVYTANYYHLSLDLQAAEEAGADDPLLPTTSRIDGPPPASITGIGELGEPRDTEAPGVTLTRLAPGALSTAREGAWNSDETRLLLGSTIVDAEMLAPLASTPSSFSEVRWSPTEPARLIGIEGNRLRGWDTEGGAFVELGTVEGVSQCGFGGGSPSRDGRFVALVCDATTLVGLDIGLGIVTGQVMLAAAPTWASASQSGRWVVHQRANAEGRQELVRHTRLLERETVVLLDPDTGDLGTDTEGRDVFVMSGILTPRYVRLEDEVEVELGVGDVEHPLGGGSVSCRGVDRKSWCIFSSPNGRIGAAQVGALDGPPLRTNELGNPVLPGIALWEHWGYSRSTSATVPAASMSPSGRQIVFTSDLGGSVNTYVLSYAGGGAPGALANADACIAFPETSKNGLDRSDWDAMFGSPARYARNGQFLSFAGDGTMRQRFVPYPRGTERVAAATFLPKSRTYTLSQSVFLEPGWELPKGAKFGFGLGAGPLPSGGRVMPDGFTARFYLRSNRDGTYDVVVYSYQADRGKQYGLGHPFGSFALRAGQWVQMTMEVTANSAANRSDGSLRGWINGRLEIDLSGIQWQAAGTPTVDSLIFSSFFGGGDPSWSPRRPVTSRYGDVCWRAGRYEG